MGFTLIFFLAFMLILAAFTSDPIVFNLIYLFAGTYLGGTIWNARVLSSIRFSRNFTTHAFPGDKIQVEIRIENRSYLPLVWLAAKELLPIEIATTSKIHKILSLQGRSRVSLNYELKPVHRGYYPVGPFRISSGDLFGFSKEQERELPPQFLTVYPKVFYLKSVPLPSNSPFGALKHTQPVFDDPCRIMGKREYQSGDALKQIDWKSSASTGILQVKLFEPSISLEAVLFINLNSSEYPLKYRYPASELAISVAASIATWCVNNKQAVGLISNGKDILDLKTKNLSLPSRKGHTQLIRFLEALARIQITESSAFIDLFRGQRSRMNWGSTAVLITPQINTELFTEISLARKSGLNVFLILCGEGSSFTIAKKTSEKLKIPLQIIRHESDFKDWQGKS